MKTRATVTIRGLVQGVAFRHHTRETALRHHVTGWVKNLPTGEVQGCFEGDEAAVEKLVEWCHRGPSRAMVEQVIIERCDYRGEFASFEIRY